MNTKLVKLLTVVCAVLALVIVGEWLYASYAKRQMLLSVKSGASKQSQADKLPELELARQTEESYADLVARPLFIQGRKPVEESSTVEVAESGSFDWQLDGIYSDKKRIAVLLSRTKKTGAKNESLKITSGDEIQGWTLTEIRKDSVILEKSGSRKELMLRKPKLKVLPQQRHRANAPKPNEEPPVIEETPENNENE
ncbi:MAG: hypothetical protein ACU88J_07245 [Gammaproteobacteria bacterium]